jgi:hypothetical protein
MTRLEKEARPLYSLVMGLYPAAFRKEFGEEMQWVFEEKLAEEKKAGSAHMLLVIFQELRDLAIHAIPERIKEWKGAPQFMFTPNPRIRILSILSPILLMAFLSLVNPRYISRFLADPLGWEIIVAVLLGLFIGWTVWKLPLPKMGAKYVLEELGMVGLLLFLDLMIILGPAVIILSQRTIPAAGSLAQFVGVVRWIILGIDCVLLGAAIYLESKRNRKSEKTPG